MSENKHLTLDERNFIEQELAKNTSFKEIAKYLSKDPTTISKEVRKHRIRKEGQAIHVNYNHCAKRYRCHRKNLCNPRCTKECRHCNNCNDVCSDFVDGTCLRLTHAPYVCNGCPEKYGCKEALFTFGEDADEEEIVQLKLTEYGYDSMIDYIVDICQMTLDETTLLPHTNGGNFCYDDLKRLKYVRATLYNYVAQNCFSARNIDLPRRVKMKKRRQKRSEPKDTAARTNRTYEDFKNYIELHPDLSVVEMDTVEGVKGGRVLLTLLFRPSRLMLAFILYEKTQKEVLRTFNMLEHELGTELFEKTFPIILTDNGTEFGDPLSLEFNEDGIGRTRIFYCNPRASYQKGMLEKNHEFIRYVLPKGTSFDNLLQTDINLMINHINSLSRDSLNWFAPIDVAKFTLDKNVIKKLNLKKIQPNEIQLNKHLLKKN